MGEDSHGRLVWFPPRRRLSPAALIFLGAVLAFVAVMGAIGFLVGSRS